MKYLMLSLVSISPSIAIAHANHGNEIYSIAHYFTGTHGLMLGALAAAALAARWVMRQSKARAVKVKADRR